MSFLPANLSLQNKKILFIGGGKVCMHKIAAVKQFSQNITILSEQFLPQVIDYGFTCIKKTYEKSDLQGFSIVFACTNNREVNKKIHADCSTQGIIINVADDPELCDFISPAIYKEGDFTISVSSGGTNVIKAIDIRNKIRDIFAGTINDFENLTITTNQNLETLCKVYLVGFGPGAPDLLTLRAYRLIQKADVILYDDLISTEILQETKAHKIYVGKRKNEHSKNQDEINTFLLEAAQKYKTIVRLKGGDPLIFGRVGEEIQFLQSHNIAVEVVPGITSASASAATCLMPLSQRSYSSSIAYCTGHQLNEFTLPQADTLVFYMAASTFTSIVSLLLKKNWTLTTPVAIITQVSTENEQKSFYTLKDFTQQEIIIQSPSIIIVGKVVELKGV